MGGGSAPGTSWGRRTRRASAAAALTVASTASALGTGVIPIGFASPAAACSITPRYAAPPPADTDGPSSVARPPTDEREALYSARVTAVTPTGIDLEVGFVSAGKPSMHLDEWQPPNASLDCGGSSGGWSAEHLAVGDTLIVRSWPTESMSRLTRVSNLAEAEIELRAGKGEAPPLSGSGPPAFLVGGPYVGANLIVLDAEAQPLRYLRTDVAPQVLAPCPDSTLVVVAGATRRNGEERFGLVVVNASTGAIDDLGGLDLGPLDSRDETMPWPVACQDSAANEIVVQVSAGATPGTWRSFDGAPVEPSALLGHPRPPVGLHGPRVQVEDHTASPSLPRQMTTITRERGTLQGVDPEVRTLDVYELSWHPTADARSRTVLPGIEAYAISPILDPRAGTVIEEASSSLPDRPDREVWPDIGDPNAPANAPIAPTDRGWSSLWIYGGSGLSLGLIIALALTISHRRRAQPSPS